ncbi:MAG: peptide ABC transporter substrate-binding protein [Bdellovibrionaceae bacterium]|nr:peptide ABC transporter substrate-binding protein [Pseudobdellovibrionaceae bacterium]
MSDILLRVENLEKKFPIYGGFFSKEIGSVQAVSGVSFEIKKGETLGLVGESGCGKSTLGRTLLRLIEPTSGSIEFDGTDITNISSYEMRKLRKRMQIIFQDPYASLNPRMSVQKILEEPIKIHGLAKDRNEQQKKIENLLDLCGLRKEVLSRYPHEFSGGQRQRICIARALAVQPDFIVCDEPVSALDVSIQAQIINLLQDLQKELELTYLFIAHDLKVVEHISDRVGVMYLGRIVEMADSDILYHRAKHPYTEALLSSIPVPDPSKKSQRIILKGDVPSPIHPPSGCRFHTRCAISTSECSIQVPVLKGEVSHEVSCLHRSSSI